MTTNAKKVEEQIEETFDGASKIADEVLETEQEAPADEPETETETEQEAPADEPETETETEQEAPADEPETETVADDEMDSNRRVMDIIEHKNRYNHLACGRLLNDNISRNSLKEFYKEFSVYGPGDAEDAELLSLLEQMFNK